MSFAILRDFLDHFTDGGGGAKAELEGVLEDLQPDDGQSEVKVVSPDSLFVADLKEWTEKETETEKKPPTKEPVTHRTESTPGPPVAAADSSALIAFGVLTEVGKVPIIDDEHSVREALQTIPLKMLVRGQTVRYSYVEKDDMRKDVIILECLSEQPKAQTPAPTKVEAPIVVADKPAPTRVTSAAAVPSTESPTIAAPVDNRKKWKGQVLVVRYKEELPIIEVRFENGHVQTILLDGDKCESFYRPAAHDTISAFCTAPDDAEDDDDDDDEGEMDELNVLKVGPAETYAGGGTITFVGEGYGVVDEDIYFTELGEGYEVGVYLEFNSVSCKKEEFNWRCLNTEKAEKPMRSARDDTNREFIDNPLNFEDRNGLAIANREELSIRLYTVDQEAEQKIVFRNNSDNPWRLLNLYLHSDKGRPQIRLKSYWRPATIHPRSSLEVKINAKGRFICNYDEYAIAHFNHDMCLVTRIRIAVGSDDNIRSANNREMAYKANRIKVQHDEPKSQTAQMFKMSRPSVKFVETRLKNYPWPPIMWEFVCGEAQEFEEKCAIEFPFLSEPLSAFNYKERLHQMVYISELHLKKCFRVYDLMDVCFKRDKFDVLYLELPNLAESRPSVLQEDMVVAKETHGGENSRVFEGIIRKIGMERVEFEFPGEFNENARFNVTFRYNRSPFRKLHHALDEMDKKFGEEFLFPDAVDGKPPLLDVTFECAEGETDEALCNAPMKLRTPSGDVKEAPWLNSDLNWHQKKAIVNALRGECRPLPHLICGPPGTGKTSTLVELVLQQYLNHNRSHMLVCTPSNSAADLILDKLVRAEQLLKVHFIRLIGFQTKERESVAAELLQYCGTVDKSKEGTEGREMSIMENGFRENCQMEYLCDFRIIIVTVGSVGTFMEMGFPEGHFTHLFVDEAGQCLEPEILVPMTLLNKDGHFVFVGDEKQLGPVVQFNPLVKWNYGLSLFERLQQFPMYNRADPENYDPRLCYQLVNNYRSLPTILKIYNTLFYGDTLKAMVSNYNS